MTLLTHPRKADRVIRDKFNNTTERGDRSKEEDEKLNELAKRNDEWTDDLCDRFPAFGAHVFDDDSTTFEEWASSAQASFA